MCTTGKSGSCYALKSQYTPKYSVVDTDAHPSWPDPQVNNQMVVGTLMNICDHPNQVSIGQEWRPDERIGRVPIIVTGTKPLTLNPKVKFFDQWGA